MPKNILVTDDDRTSIELVRHKLEHAGYEIRVAANGEVALAELNKKPADLILLDVEMPVMNGYTFMMERSKSPVFSAIPVIIMTAHKENQPLFQRHGVRAYMVKPLD